MNYFVNDGERSLSARFEYLLGNSLHSDFTFIIEDYNDEIPAHKLVISLASPVINRLVYGNILFSSTNSLKVDGIRKTSFMEILRYIYTDKIHISKDNVIEVLHKANYFGLVAIEKKCVHYLERILDISTVPWIFPHLFHTPSSHELLNKCQQYIRIEPLVFFAAYEFQFLSIPAFKFILQMDPINCTEVDLFEALIKLARARCFCEGLHSTGSNQRKVVDGAENFLRMDSLTACEFDNCLAIEPDFFTSNEIQRIRENIDNLNQTFSEGRRKWYTYHEILCGSGYEWTRCVNGEIPVGAVSVSHKNAKPVFIGRGYFRNTTHIAPVFTKGRMYLPEYRTCWLSFTSNDGSELVEVDEFEILVADNVKDPYIGNEIPNDAIYIGSDEYNFSTYLGRAWLHGELLPAKVKVISVGVVIAIAYVSYENAEENDEFEFLRMDPGSFTWEKSRNGEVPEKAILAGQSGGVWLYFGRYLDNETYIYGTIHQINRNESYFEHGGQMNKSSSHEYLVKVNYKMAERLV